MKIMVISDVHGNLDALYSVLQIGYDKLIFLGDFVDYGPEPAEVIRLIQKQANIVLKGNHDHALAYNMDCKCSQKLKKLSVETRENFSKKVVKKSQIDYIKTLSHAKQTFVDGFHFFAAHAAPDDMYKYISPDITDEELLKIFNNIKEKFIFFGHSHLPFIRKINDKFFINPGSVGQPRDGDNRASVVVIEDDIPKIKRVKYDINKVVEKINNSMSGIKKESKEKLIEILKNGKI